MKSKLFIIDGPSGSGKDYLIDEVIKKQPNLIKAINYTDRKPRPDENKNAYHFVSHDEFDRLIKSGEIFEREITREDGVRYGSSKKEVIENLNQGKNIIKVTGVIRWDYFKSQFQENAVFIFIKPSDINALKERLRNKYPGISENEIEIRFQNAFDKKKLAKYDFVVENPEGHPEQAINKIIDIISEQTEVK